MTAKELIEAITEFNNNLPVKMSVEPTPEQAFYIQRAAMLAIRELSELASKQFYSSRKLVDKA